MSNLSEAVSPPGPPTILVATSNVGTEGWIERAAGPAWCIEACRTTHQLFARLENHARPVRALVVGSRLEDALREDFAERLADAIGGIRLFYVDDEDGASALKDVVETPRFVYYRFDYSLPETILRELLDRTYTQAGVEENDTGSDERLALVDGDNAGRVRTFVRRVGRIAGAESPEVASKELTVAFAEAFGCVHCRCLFHDAPRDMLWVTDSDDEYPLASGIAGFAARMKQTVVVERAAADPRYCKEIDDPDGRGDESLLVFPICSARGRVMAVLSCVRSPDSPRFGPGSAPAFAARYSAMAAPPLSVFELQLRSARLAEKDEQLSPEELFRPEAVDAQWHLNRKDGDIVRVVPPWVPSIFWVIFVALLASIAFIVFGEVNEYAEGPGVVRFLGEREVMAPWPGVVSDIETQIGDIVASGDPLVRVTPEREAAEIARLEADYDSAQIASLQQPDDPIARREVARLRSELERTKASLGRGEILAPVAGRVVDMRVAMGQQLAQGEAVVTIASADSRPVLIGFLEPNALPHVRPGMRLRFRLKHIQASYQDLVISRVARGAVGAQFAQRQLGPKLAGSVPLSGALVVVQAEIPNATFRVHGNNHEYSDGMLADVRVTLKVRPVYQLLFPGLME